MRRSASVKRPSSASSVTEPSPAPARGSAPAIARSSSSADPLLTSMLNAWPPSRPTSIRTCSFSIRHHLRENTMDGIRVDERDLEPEEAGLRLLVDELRTLARERPDRLVDVRHLI